VHKTTWEIHALSSVTNRVTGVFATIGEFTSPPTRTAHHSACGAPVCFVCAEGEIMGIGQCCAELSGAPPVLLPSTMRRLSLLRLHPLLPPYLLHAILSLSQAATALGFTL
jgi:hypothetical protein